MLPLLIKWLESFGFPFKIIYFVFICPLDDKCNLKRTLIFFKQTSLLDKSKSFNTSPRIKTFA